ncbi:AAA family ATPase [Actinomadura rayongensis]|uniref:AAA family ATPase n=1 Tax=Actinomadura rayongensis TaxID=1429076 RepID=A0A6I4WBJ5_9ACTN|nr:AAA family ATPase [Actinomadura rayongensis]
MHFVGRRTELDRLRRVLATVEAGTFLDVVGIHGVGKTSLLNEFARLTRPDPDVRVFTIDMWDYRLGEGFVDDFGPDASAAVLFETFQRSLKLTTLFTAGAGEEEHEAFAGLRAAHREHLQLHELLLAKRGGGTCVRPTTESARESASPPAGGNVIAGSHLTNAVQARDVHNIIINSTPGDEETRVLLRGLQNLADDVFVDAWTAFTANRRVLIAVDGFETVADDELGLWMARLAARLPRTLVVAARTPSSRPVVFQRNEVQQLVLRNFDLAEVGRYLAGRFHPASLRPDVADVAYAATAGHPGGVSLVAELIAETEGAAISPASLQRRLNRLPDDWERRWGGLVELILTATNNAKLHLAVEAAAVAGSFDDALLGELVGADGVTPVELRSLIRRMDDLGLLQQLVRDGLSDRLRLHEFVRRSVAARLRTLHHRERWLPLHRIAAEHYYSLLNDWDGGAFDSYLSWYAFENPEWQENKRSWLWHTGMLTDRRHRQVARARLVRVFLMAFWWWGTYLPFPFNRQLLEDWGRATALWEPGRASRPRLGRSEDQELVDALTFLLDAYPAGLLERPADTPWDEIRGKMLLVRDLCGLGPGGRPGGLSPAEAVDLDWADALITLVHAHTRRFRDPADPAGEELYARAAALFTALGDEWTVRWIEFERADLAFEAGDPAGAARRLAATAAVVRADGAAGGDWDHELLGNLHRLAADLHWGRGELGESAQEYGRAVAHAYVFQGVPNPPDEYTRQFYTEMTTRTARRIGELAASPADAAVFVTGLRAQVPVPGNEADRTGTQFFPVGPTLEELRARDTAFMTRWRTSPLCSVDPFPGLSHVVDLLGDD